jgi:hypothetical protein
VGVIWPAGRIVVGKVLVEGELLASVGQHPERGRKITPLLSGAKLLTRSSMGHITRLELEHQTSSD